LRPLAKFDGPMRRTLFLQNREATRGIARMTKAKLDMPSVMDQYYTYPRTKIVPNRANSSCFCPRRFGGVCGEDLQNQSGVPTI